MNTAFNILFILALTCNVFPFALGLNKDNQTSTKVNLFYSLCLGLLFGILFWTGSLLGSTFMHVLNKYVYIFVFAIFLMISIRMIVNAYKVRKGTTIFYIENFKTLFIISIVSGMNAFMIALGADYFSNWGFYLPVGIVLGAFVWSIIGALLPVTKINVLITSFALSISSVIIFVLGIVYLVSSI